ncbi:NAD-dependent epimerase/dehydratase family protein, partial [Amphritea sp.]|uniref:NAD-dependent epimerase/dehydratase family protein n=1 Tax=Amphritea sp. TaxID=1872502 RepID=UPI0025BBB4F3
MPIDDNDLQFIANEVSKDFCFFKNKRVFLTGGTGFFGKWILESFIYLNKVKKLNIKVLILSRSPEKFCEDYPQFSNHDFFSFIKGDIRDFSNVSENYDLIIHAATD